MTRTLAYIPSPSQGVWHLGPFPIRAYALFILIGVVVALIIGDRRWEARGGERGVIYDIALWAVPFGLIGARLYHVITDWPTYFGEGDAGLIGVLRIWDGGLGIWGAVALGGVGAWIGCHRRGIRLPAFADAIAPGIVLAQAIGRIGNYFNQELYGRPTKLPWGLEVYERRDASGALDPLNGVSTGQPLIPGVEAVHPTFLYESLWNLLVFAALIYIDRRFKIGHGRLFAMYVAGYCFGRFWIELLRVDEARLIDGIRVNSFTSMFVFIGAVVYIMVAPKGREDPATLRGKPEEAEEEEAEEEEDTSVEEFVKELTAVAATTGVVAAAKVAGKEEDEDARAVGDVTEESEAAAEAEVGATEAETAEVEAEPADESESVEPEAMEPDVAEPEAVEVAGDEAAEDEAAEPVAEAAAEAAAEAEALAEDIAEAPSEDIIEAQEFAAAREEAEAEAGEPEAVEAAEPEAVEPEPEVADEAEESEVEADAVVAQPEVAEAAEGLGAVGGEEAVEAQEAAAEVHQAAVAAVEEAGAVAAEVATEEPEVVASEPEVADEADEPEAQTVATEVASEAPDSDDAETDDAATKEPHTADESGSRLRRWWRGRRGR